nr:hypothetical protein [Gammaproteobacteria bacterium]
LLEGGVPKLDPGGASVGGWRTMVHAVMINTYGLGGDSEIVFDREQRDFAIGPRRVKPLTQLHQEYPNILDELERQLEQPYVATHAAQFAVVNSRAERPAGLSSQQRELWQIIARKPVALVELFADQTLERPLQRLVQRGLVLLSGFTPTDASHVLGVQNDWSATASRAGAELLMRYSDFNLGKTFNTVENFAEFVRERVSQLTALAVLETVLADSRDRPGLQLSSDERKFIRSTFIPAPDMPLSLSAQLTYPVMGIGAPAASYYPRVGEMLSTSIELPEFASVANALGAVVGSVRQSQTLTITPAGGKRVRVHALDGPREFDQLDTAADWAREQLEEQVAALAKAAGATEYELSSQRNDTIVDNNGDKVFFESTIAVHATGRPATLQDQL